MTYQQISQLSDQHLAQLTALYQQQWWSRGRSFEDVKKMVEGSQAIVVFEESRSGRLAGFCRLISDGIYRAMLLDVMVDERDQKMGLGRKLLEAVREHPRVRDVEVVWLCCDPRMVSFYEKWDFQLIEDGRAWMHRLLNDDFPLPEGGHDSEQGTSSG